MQNEEKGNLETLGGEGDISNMMDLEAPDLHCCRDTELTTYKQKYLF